MLKQGKWEVTDPFYLWQFIDGGRVLIHGNDGEVDEQYRWEILGRNEKNKSITIKYWNPSWGGREHREWEFAFAEDGKSANFTGIVKKDSKTHDVKKRVVYRRQ